MHIDDLLSNIRRFPIVTDDTRDLLPGGIFVSGGGRSRSGEYLKDALDCGAAIVVSDVDLPSVPPSMLVRVADRSVASANLASAFYNDPSMRMLIAGVTGTCGKTTSTYLLEGILQAAGHTVGVIGTEAIRYKAVRLPSPNTTPSAFALNRTLSAMTEAGCTAVAMEVSSHATIQRRTHGIAFDGAIFTNLSIEHLDLHGTMDAYFAAKAMLFTEYARYARRRGKLLKAAINLDSPHGRRLYREIGPSDQGGASAVGFGTTHADGIFDGSALQALDSGIKGVVADRTDPASTEILVESPLVGQFNAENILGAVALGARLGIAKDAIERGLRQTNAVPGRMERAVHTAGISVVVDFAHKPGALEVVLETLRPITSGKLICVFGCGGKRDAAKRPVMGKIAAAKSDLVIVTADNLRGEPFDEIAGQILQGVSVGDAGKVKVVPDRRAAIAQAIEAARRGDTVLIAGRGAETVLSVNTDQGQEVRIPFDDCTVAAELARSLLNP